MPRWSFFAARVGGAQRSGDASGEDGVAVNASDDVVGDLVHVESAVVFHRLCRPGDVNPGREASSVDPDRFAYRSDVDRRHQSVEVRNELDALPTVATL